MFRRSVGPRLKNISSEDDALYVSIHCNILENDIGYKWAFRSREQIEAHPTTVEAYQLCSSLI